MANSLDDLEQLLQKYNRDLTPGLAVMLIADQKILLQKGYGLSNLENRKPIFPRSNFNLASLSKAFTAAAIAQLEEQSLLNTSDSIIKFFPKVSKVYSAIQIKDLIYHTSGLPNFASRHWKKNQLITNRQVIDYLVLDELNFIPGEQFEYNDVGYILLASLIEKITSMSYAEYLLRYIFIPAGMENTLLLLPKQNEINQQVTGYSEWPFFNVFNECPIDMVYGDGAIYSSLQDLLYWIRAIENETVFSEKTKKKIFTSGLDNKNQSIKYGYGWFIDYFKDTIQYYHQGEWLGFRTYIANLPEKKVWLVILSNSCGINTFSIADRILTEFSE
ncbi:MAG: beta-lactamase family protein [Tatlockia sp.]|nr:beta-lactamase family protein [Tatlockia sp.]